MLIRNAVFAAVLCLSAMGCKKIASAIANGSTGENLLIFDDFNRADEAIEASGDWDATTFGTFNVSDEMAVPVSGAMSNHTTPITADPVAVFVKATFPTAETNPFAVVTAKVDDVDFRNASQYYVCGFDSSTSVLLLTHNEAVMGIEEFTLSSGTEVQITLVVSGDDLSCVVASEGQTETVTLTASVPSTGTYFGLGGSSPTVFDDFGVTDQVSRVFSEIRKIGVTIQP